MYLSLASTHIVSTNQKRCLLHVHAYTDLGSMLPCFHLLTSSTSDFSLFAIPTTALKTTGSWPFCTLNSVTKRWVSESWGPFCIPSMANWIWMTSLFSLAFFHYQVFALPLILCTGFHGGKKWFKDILDDTVATFGRLSSFRMVTIVPSFPFHSSGGGDLRTWIK